MLARTLATLTVLSASAFAQIPAPGVGGAFGWSAPQFLQTGANCHYHQLADVDADGRVDVVVPTRSTNTIHVFRNIGNGAFALDAPVTTVGDPIAAEVTDLNHDGYRDLLVVGLSSRNLRVHWGTPLGTFITGPDYFLSTEGHAIEIADFNLDGWEDVAVTLFNSGVTIWMNNGAGVLTSLVALGATGTNTYYGSAVDLDGDGDKDIAIPSFDTGSIAFWRNNLPSGFSYIFNPVSLQGTQPGRLSFADFDGDGLLEFISPFRETPSLGHYEATGFSSFNWLGNISVPTSGGLTGYWSTTADLDMDGDLDVAFGGTGQGKVGVALQTTPGTFGTLQDLDAGTNVNCIRVADLNGDGSPDITTAAHDSGAVVVRFSTLFIDCNSNGTADTQDITLASSADCDGNGVPDECDVLVVGRDCDANGLLDTCEIAANASLDLNHNAVLDECDPVGTPYCFGDGTGAICPCDPGQAGPIGGGCKNATGNGGRLRAFGNSQVSLDSVTMRTTGLDSQAIAMLFQGTMQQAGGLGFPFGDGLLCVNGTITRLIIRAATNGTISYGRDMPGDPALHAAGSVSPSALTLHYQVWYRDSAPFCTAFTHNLTNGLSVTWVP